MRRPAAIGGCPRVGPLAPTNKRAHVARDAPPEVGPGDAGQRETPPDETQGDAAQVDGPPLTSWFEICHPFRAVWFRAVWLRSKAWGAVLWYGGLGVADRQTIPIYLSLLPGCLGCT